MNKAQLTAEKERLERKRREIDQELSPVRDELRKLELLELVIDHCDNCAGHYFHPAWTDRYPSGDDDARLLRQMSKSGLLRIKDYNGKTFSIENYEGNAERFVITPKGRASLQESEKELA